MILRRSLQSRSPALEDWTSPAVIAASRIIWHPMASHAAGTVNQTSAAPWRDKRGKEESEIRVRVWSPIHDIGEFIHTEVGNGTNLASYLLFGVLPNARKEVDY